MLRRQKTTRTNSAKRGISGSDRQSGVIVKTWTVSTGRGPSSRNLDLILSVTSSRPPYYTYRASPSSRESIVPLQTQAHPAPVIHRWLRRGSQQREGQSHCIDDKGRLASP